MVGPTILEMRNTRATLRQIAAQLTSDGIKTARGGEWTATAVRNVMKRLGYPNAIYHPTLISNYLGGMNHAEDSDFVS